MSDFALYRKHRPSTFAEVIGQEHITSSLTHALDKGIISHAYLFTGPRGTGKTTVARLLARAINCEGKSPKPCNKCEICEATINSNLDIIEIDAASNRGIDDARELRDKVNLVPTRAKYKVYIIDEVHMLTKEAFNALLKTLEEPPAHAVFIMATTEAHKIPATIISRTQRFSFHSIADDNLEKQLIAIAKKEKLDLEPAAAHTLAVASQGGFRDAISMLDQARGGGHKITNDRVLSILGWSELGKLDELIDNVLKGDSSLVLKVLDEIIESGAQPEQLHHQLLLALRDRLHNAVTNKSDQVAQISAVTQALLAMQTAGHPQIALEATLLSILNPVAAPTVHATAPVAVHTTPRAQAAIPAAPAVPDSDPADMARWPKALIEIKSKNNSLYALLQSCEIRLSSDELMIYCRFNFHKDRLMEAKNRAVIEKALETVYNKSIRVECELKTMTTEAPTANATNELVTTAIDILGGELIDG